MSDPQIGGFDAAINIGLQLPDRSRGTRSGHRGSDAMGTAEAVPVDGRNVMVERTSEQGAADYSAFTVTVPSGQFAQLVGYDPTRSMLRIANASTGPVLIGRSGDVQTGSGFALPAGAVHDPTSVGEVWVYVPVPSPGSPYDAVIGVWVERG